MPRCQYLYERLTHHQLFDVGQDKLLLLFDLWFTDFQRLPLEQRQRPEMQKWWFTLTQQRQEVAGSRRLTNIRPEPVPRWVRRRLRGSGRRGKSWSPRA